MQQQWDLWFPGAASCGLPFARARIAQQQHVWVHAAPATLAVQVWQDGRVVAQAGTLERDSDSLPMTRLELAGEGLVRQDRWPTDADLGSVVLLPGGEAGILQGWWNAGDGSAWRWRVEFSNHR